MFGIRKYFDVGSLIIIIVTFTLFLLALFTKGLTHDLLLETAVFLISVKLIIMAYKNITGIESVHQKLDEIYAKINAVEFNQSQKDNDNI